MNDPVQRLTAAEHHATVARQRLSSTLSELQQRLAPKRLAREAARDLAEASRTGADTVRNNPGAIAGVSALAGLFLARHRIAALIGRLRTRNDPRRTTS